MRIYKHGFATGIPQDRAKDDALAWIRDHGDYGPVASTQIIQTQEHEAAGEYLVEIVIGGD